MRIIDGLFYCPKTFRENKLVVVVGAITYLDYSVVCVADISDSSRCAIFQR